MIYGIGVDIVKIERIKNAAEKWGSSFVEKILTPHEIEYCYKKKDPYPSVAVRFAAKEALIKAVGSGSVIKMQDMEVVNDSSGRPSINVKNRLEELFKEKKITGCHLSLSHEKEFGVATVVLEVQGTVC
jgi:holo-[acyl-carrier protein] synthase